MKNGSSGNEIRKVAAATRGAVVGVAARMRVLRQKTTGLARDAEKKWQTSGAQRRKAAANVKKVGQRALDMGKGIGKGLKEGMAELGKKR